MRGLKQRREENNFKSKMRNGKMVVRLCRKKKTDNFLGFSLFGVNGHKKIGYQRKGAT
jgi:hypothetical protein